MENLWLVTYLFIAAFEPLYATLYNASVAYLYACHLLLFAPNTLLDTVTVALRAQNDFLRSLLHPLVYELAQLVLLVVLVVIANVPWQLLVFTPLPLKAFKFGSSPDDGAHKPLTCSEYWAEEDIRRLFDVVVYDEEKDPAAHNCTNDSGRNCARLGRGGHHDDDKGAETASVQVDYPDVAVGASGAEFYAC